MRLSIVIAAHNEGSSLWKTVDSIASTAGGLEYEVVISDDASKDDSIAELRQHFPEVQIHSASTREGASPAKDRGARQAKGDVLVFLDGHSKPEPGALDRMVQDVDRLDGRAIITPEVAALDEAAWVTQLGQAGNGYEFDLETYACWWISLSKMKMVKEGRREFYESPALIGCAFAISRELYLQLRGFDPNMRQWGVEDLDFGLKAWTMGYRILHDPKAVVGHRFQKDFQGYGVAAEYPIANQIRSARKNLTPSIWEIWLEKARQRCQAGLIEHPEGLWARAWELFIEDRKSAEEERVFLLGNRKYDEFWYAKRFDRPWPSLTSSSTSKTSLKELKRIARAVGSPHPSHHPPCTENGVLETAVPSSGFDTAHKLTLDQAKTFYSQFGYRFVLRYVARSTPDTNPGNLHSAEIKDILKSCLALMPVQRSRTSGWTAATGTSDGNAAAQNVHALSFPSGTVIWCSFENTTPSAITTSNMLNYATNWANAVTGAGYGYAAGLYIGANLAYTGAPGFPGFTAAQLNALPYQHFWKSCSGHAAGVLANIPPRNYQLRQLQCDVQPPPWPFTGTWKIDTDTLEADDDGGLPTWLISSGS